MSARLSIFATAGRVPLLDRTYDMLRYAERRSHYVFPREDGGAFSTFSPYLWEEYKKGCRKAGFA